MPDSEVIVQRLNGVEAALVKVGEKIDALIDKVAKLELTEATRAAVETERARDNEVLRALPGRVEKLEEEHGADVNVTVDKGPPAVIQVMNHPKFLWLLGASILIAGLLAGAISGQDLKELNPWADSPPNVVLPIPATASPAPLSVSTPFQPSPVPAPAASGPTSLPPGSEGMGLGPEID